MLGLGRDGHVAFDDASYRFSFAHGSWPRMLAEELHQLPAARARRGAAFAAVPLVKNGQGGRGARRNVPWRR